MTTSTSSLSPSPRLQGPLQRAASGSSRTTSSPSRATSKNRTETGIYRRGDSRGSSNKTRAAVEEEVNPLRVQRCVSQLYGQDENNQRIEHREERRISSLSDMTGVSEVADLSDFSDGDGVHSMCLGASMGDFGLEGGDRKGGPPLQERSSSNNSKS